MTIPLSTIDGTGAEVFISTQPGDVVGGQQTLIPQSVPTINGLPVSSGNPIPITTAASSAVAKAGNAFRVVTAGTSVIAINAGAITLTARIVNPVTANGDLIVDPDNDPGVTAPGTFGTSEAIPPGGSWTAPGNLTGSVRANAATDDHPFTVVVY